MNGTTIKASQLLFLSLALLVAETKSAVDSRSLVEEGQSAFQSGSYGAAATSLEQALKSLRKQGNIKAEVLAKSVIVLGTVTGNITASDKVEIRDGGSVDGDIISPRVAISEGARFRGSVDMQKKAAKPTQQSSASAQPKAAQPPPHSVGQQRDNPIAATAAAH